jgi:hypothetical protein
MVVDSEPIKVVKPNDAVGSMFVDLLSRINIKVALFLLFTFVILSSDVFTNRILSSVSGAVNGKISTNYGTFLQGMLLAISYIIIDILVRNNVI